MIMLNSDIDLSYSNIYRLLKDFLANSNESKLLNFLDQSLMLLDGLEGLLPDGIDFNETLLRNLNRVEEVDNSKEFKINQLRASILKDKLDNKKSSLYVFNKMINHISKISESKFKLLDLDLFDMKEISQNNQVFLSYAHSDKLYTCGLFLLFKSNGIFLFIDWMHNDIIEETTLLKNQIDLQLRKSNQFLFLRTFNSDLGIKGGRIRQWCSWEIGNYYCKKKDSKFFTEIYSQKEHSNTNNLLGNFKPLKGFLGGKMI